MVPSNGFKNNKNKVNKNIKSMDTCGSCVPWYLGCVSFKVDSLAENGCPLHVFFINSANHQILRCARVNQATVRINL